MGANGKGNGKKRGDAPLTSARLQNGNGHDGLPNGKAKEAASEATPHAPAEAEHEPEAAASDPAHEPEETASSEAAASSEPAASTHEAPAPHGAAWANPVARFEARWTWLESKLITFVLLWQILSLVAWVLLNGLSESVTTTAGTVFRAALLGIALGVAAWQGTKKHVEDRRTIAALVAILAAIAVVVLWRRAAGGGAGAALSLDRGVVGYFDNVKGWLQEGSTLTLLGGLRGLGTRLTLWLALLGGSLATAAGKHIHVDVVFRFLPKKARMPVAILNYLFAAAVCFAGVWGFFDHIAIESYGSRAEDTAGAKVENALHHIGNHAFFTRKQIGLDLRSLPHVIAGERYDQWMSADAWNEWVDGAGFEDRFDPERVKLLRVREGTHPPFVVSPDGETTRAALAHTLGLVFPFGLLAIGLRFLLRALLTLSGHIAADPDEAHKEDLRVANEAPAAGGAP